MAEDDDFITVIEKMKSLGHKPVDGLFGTLYCKTCKMIGHYYNDFQYSNLTQFRCHVDMDVDITL